ncbi:hypothetical protein [Rhodopseudomonas sp. P2A-2r]|uniref:hypothetical protein n=1 Tax=unclassified Rhodopseudomonas TaxID=2638247 RepID=UPI002233FE94|nr:hypothetical protein [Rhodopseudomonas sp. P2A-2r]UZE46853.1 hypothetical protein ONR75_17595 [Rhodopseudomonas sp. P2A-2r]
MPPHLTRSLQTALSMLAIGAAVLAPQYAQAANGAYAVDAADISDLGSCKVESWLSTATNTDFSAVANPSCVVDIVRPVELSVMTNRSRSDGDWGTSVAPKAKINLVPTGIGKFGASALGGVAFDAQTGQNTAMFGEIPVTWRFSEVTRINLNAGWLWDRTVDRHYFTYGAGFDWKLTDVFQYTIEVYGQVGAADIPSVTRPKFQTGLRYRPNDIFSVDVIYGHNITGENADWITVGTTIRFPPPGSTRDSNPHL